MMTVTLHAFIFYLIFFNFRVEEKDVNGCVFTHVAIY